MLAKRLLSGKIIAHRALVALFAVVFAAPIDAADHTGSGHATFSWALNSIHFYDSARFRDSNIREQLEAEIVEQLSGKGLTLTDERAAADLELSYIAVLQNSTGDAEIADFRAKHPEIVSLPDQPSHFEDGMLYVKLVERTSRVKVWDFTYRGIVALDMPAEPRRQRMRELVSTVFSDYRRSAD